jgi:hypothetical protein
MKVGFPLESASEDGDFSGFAVRGFEGGVCSFVKVGDYTKDRNRGCLGNGGIVRVAGGLPRRGLG